VLAIAGIASAEEGEPSGPPAPEPLLDRTQQSVHSAVSRTAMHIDSWLGNEHEEVEPGLYDEAWGSVAPAILWDEFDGFQTRFRFRVTLPLPRTNERFDAFIGRVNRDEYVTERALPSGAFPRQYGPEEDEQTIFGIRYRDRPHDERGYFDLGTGIRLRFPLDPYVKGSYVYDLGSQQVLLLSLRETVFWQNSEKLGLTSRIDLSRVIEERWLFRWTGSATFSQRTDGVRGYSTLTTMRGLPRRRALAMEFFMNGETDAEVPLHDYGVKFGYRQSVVRDWLVLETRVSLSWPKEFRDQPRAPSWGVGIGFEMFFGTEQFLARPVTF
jgi:hypothetical protein